MVAMSPSFASTQGGRCAWTLLLLLSYLLYFLTFWRSSLWMTTVCLLETEPMVRTRIVRGRVRRAWTAQRESSHPRCGRARSRHAEVMSTDSRPITAIAQGGRASHR